MGCRFFADHCVSNAIMQTLRDGGHEVVRLREQLPVESPDAIVIAKAQQLDAIFLVFEWGLYGYCDLSASRLPRDYRHPSEKSPSALSILKIRVTMAILSSKTRIFLHCHPKIKY